MYAIVYMFSHQFQVPFFITDYLSVLVPYIFTSFSNTSGYCNCRICVSVPYVFTSFSNRNIRSFHDCRFQYHTFLHHSQTYVSFHDLRLRFSTIYFYIILKHYPWHLVAIPVSVPYIFTSFSNQPCDKVCTNHCFSTIHFYIILKRSTHLECRPFRFSTIHFYIILKPDTEKKEKARCFSTIHFYIILKLLI